MIIIKLGTVNYFGNLQRIIKSYLEGEVFTWWAHSLLSKNVVFLNNGKVLQPGWYHRTRGCFNWKFQFQLSAMTLWCWSSGLIQILRHSRVFSGSGDFEQTLFQRKHERLDCGEKQIRSKEQWQWHLLFLNSKLAVEWCCFIENQQRGDLTIDHAWSRSCKSSHSQADVKEEK